MSSLVLPLFSEHHLRKTLLHNNENTAPEIKAISGAVLLSFAKASDHLPVDLRDLLQRCHGNMLIGLVSRAGTGT